uniref:G_PROTEIN_RECEP_F1_2 domain-containing protein n=1 Tax=Panagrellus redivivus TaxID=6233 RepID=A0A7E4V848_PANRE
MGKRGHNNNYNSAPSKKNKNQQPQRGQNQQQNAQNRPNAPNQADGSQSTSSASPANTPRPATTPRPPQATTTTAPANDTVLTPEQQQRETNALISFYTTSVGTYDLKFYNGYRLLLCVSAITCFYHNCAMILILCLLCAIHDRIAEILIFWYYTRP